ncbi:hypothetical protein GEMRC1_013889 [Eukaryota sp. GEM-RC1]
MSFAVKIATERPSVSASQCLDVLYPNSLITLFSEFERSSIRQVKCASHFLSDSHLVESIMPSSKAPQPLLSLSSLDVRLLIVVMMNKLFPALYKTVRIFLIGNLPSVSGLDIASQIAWLDVIYEVVYECLILPLFFFLGALINTNNFHQSLQLFQGRLKSILASASIIYSTLSLVVIITLRPILVFMEHSEVSIDESITYMKLEIISLFFSTLFRIMSVSLMFLKGAKGVVYSGYKYLLYILTVQMFLSIIGDLFLLSTFIFSLNIGVVGIAISNIVTNIVSLLMSWAFLAQENVKIFSRGKIPFRWQSQWFKIVVLRETYQNLSETFRKRFHVSTFPKRIFICSILVTS